MSSMGNNYTNSIGVGVGAIITNSENKMLFLERNNATNQIWTIPGGCIEYEESPLITLKREIKEETGLEIVSYKFVGYLDLVFNNQHWLSFVFHIKRYDGKIHISGNEPFTRADWFSRNNLPKLDFIAQKTINQFNSSEWTPE